MAKIRNLYRIGCNPPKKKIKKIWRKESQIGKRLYLWPTNHPLNHENKHWGHPESPSLPTGNRVHDWTTPKGWNGKIRIWRTTSGQRKLYRKHLFLLGYRRSSHLDSSFRKAKRKSSNHPLLTHRGVRLANARFLPPTKPKTYEQTRTLLRCNNARSHLHRRHRCLPLHPPLAHPLPNPLNHKIMEKKFYKLTWGEGYAQICSSRLQVATILFDLLADHQSVKIELTKNPS